MKVSQLFSYYSIPFNHKSFCVFTFILLVLSLFRSIPVVDKIFPFNWLCFHLVVFIGKSIGMSLLLDCYCYFIIFLLLFWLIVFLLLTLTLTLLLLFLHCVMWIVFYCCLVFISFLFVDGITPVIAIEAVNTPAERKTPHNEPILAQYQ